MGMKSDPIRSLEKKRGWGEWENIIEEIKINYFSSQVK